MLFLVSELLGGTQNERQPDRETNMPLPYPNDPDGGSRRQAAIEMLFRKLGMAERDGDLARAEKYRQQLADAKDETKPLR